MGDPVSTDAYRAMCIVREFFFREIYEGYKKPLVTFLYRLLAHKDETEDLYQEVFKKFWLYLQGREEPLTSEETRKLLYTFAHNEVRDWYRRWYLKQEKLPHVSLEEAEETPCELPSMEDKLGEQEQLQWVFTHMSPKYRICLVLQDLYGYSQKEIANILDIKETTVSTNVLRARKKFLAIMGNIHHMGKGEVVNLRESTEKIVNTNVLRIRQEFLVTLDNVRRKKEE